MSTAPSTLATLEVTVARTGTPFSGSQLIRIQNVLTSVNFPVIAAAAAIAGLTR